MLSSKMVENSSGIELYNKVQRMDGVESNGRALGWSSGGVCKAEAVAHPEA